MNRLSFPLALVALAIAVATFVLSQSNTDLVYVDVNKLVEGYDRTKTEREAFEKKANTLKANVDSLITDWQGELQSYEKERSGMTKKEKELKQELLANKQQQLNNYQQAVQKQIQEEDQRTTQTVLNDINAFVKEYGKQHGHAMIFGAGGNGNIMYAADATDLTDEILTGLNARFNGK